MQKKTNIEYATKTKKQVIYQNNGECSGSSRSWYKPQNFIDSRYGWYSDPLRRY